MTPRMRMTGLKSILLAVGLAVVGTGSLSTGAAMAQAPAATVAPAVKPADTPPQKPVSNDPLLAQDGAPAMSVLPGIGHPTDGVFGLQPQVTPNGRRAHGFHDTILFPMTVVISLLVLFLLGWVVVKYRRAAHPVPSKTSHNTMIEVIWTLAPVIVLALIAAPSIGLLAAQFKPAPAGAVTLKAIGNQWYWSYQYPDNGGFELTANMLKEKDQVSGTERARTDADGPRLLAADQRIVLPVGVPIRLITTSNDVIHSWAMPAFWIKLDAIPGRLNETSFTIEKPGVYFGQCSELCGARHGFMPISVEAVSPATFAAWVKAKGGTMPATGPGGAPKPSSAVIPQPGSDAADNTSAPAGNAAGPLENATVAAPVSTQGATGNPAGAGNAGQ